MVIEMNYHNQLGRNREEMDDFATRKVNRLVHLSNNRKLKIHSKISNRCCKVATKAVVSHHGNARPTGGGRHYTCAFLLDDGMLLHCTKRAEIQGSTEVDSKVKIKILPKTYTR